MPTLLLRLAGPMQAWGTTSRFDKQRDTGKEPSKSGVIGLLAAAMGIDREDWINLEPLTNLKMGVRHDRSGVLRKDYQTAGCAQPFSIIRADGKLSEDGIPSDRFYLADAVFLVGLEGRDKNLLAKAHEKLKNPTWVIGLGRKPYMPSEPIFLEDGIIPESLLEALCSYPLLCPTDEQQMLQYSFESSDNTGRMVMDQPLSSFAERRFGSRFVKTEWLPFKKEAINVPA